MGCSPHSGDALCQPDQPLTRTAQAGPDAGQAEAARGHLQRGHRRKTETRRLMMSFHILDDDQFDSPAV
jgi:hypothetical protein